MTPKSGENPDDDLDHVPRAPAEQRPPVGSLRASGVQPTRRRRPGQVLLCGWCQQQITVRSRGRTPKWYSDTCRHRAWEQTRAAANGLIPAVEIVDRPIEIEVHHTDVQRVEVPVEVPPRGGPGWVTALAELARQLDEGRIYDRDLDALTDRLRDVVDAVNRRHQRMGRYRPRGQGSAQ